MSEEELAAQAAELAAQVKAQTPVTDEAPRGRRPSQREIKAADRRRRIDEARKTSLTSIYRRLAKVLHPDLERDPVAREEKSARMQELTRAHAEQDLHTLLRLELEWLQQAGGQASRLADDTLGIYNDALKQQIAELDFEQSVLLDHPKYAEVVEVDDLGIPVVTDGPARVEMLDDTTATLSASLARLQSGAAFDDVRTAIRARRAEARRGGRRQR
jgi:hypothetical protein